MKDFKGFVAKNKGSLYAFAEKNTEYNSNGQAVISPNDPWAEDNIWDADFKELIAHEKNFAAGSLVC